MSYPLRCTYSLHFILFIFVCAFTVLISSLFWMVLYMVVSCGQVSYSFIYSLYNNYRHDIAMNQCRKLDIVTAQHNYTELRECYHRLYPFLKEEPEFLLSYAKYEYYSGCYKHSLHLINKAIALSGDPIFRLMEGKCMQALANYGQAEKLYLKAYYRIPHKTYPLYLLMNMYIDTKKHPKAITIAKQIVHMKPKVISEEFEYIQNEARMYLNQ